MHSPHCLSSLDAVLPSVRKQGEYSLAIQGQFTLWSNFKASLKGEMRSLWHRKISRWRKEPAKLAHAISVSQQDKGRGPKQLSHTKGGACPRLWGPIFSLLAHAASGLGCKPKGPEPYRNNTILSIFMCLSTPLHLRKAVNEF